MDRDRAVFFLDEAQRIERLVASDVVGQLAVLGTFNPARLAQGARGDDVVHLLCRTLPPRGDIPEAMLSERYRIDALALMLERGGHRELARVRNAIRPDYDTPLQRMLDAFVLDTQLSVDERDEDELLASLDVWWWATEAVSRAHLSVERPVEPSRDLIESRLALLEVTRAVRRLAEEGCIERKAELACLHAYRTAELDRADLTDEPAMVVYGIGGVGKSTLVAQFVMDLYRIGLDGDRQAWAYLDLDRPTLSTGEPRVILADIVHQVAAQFPEYRRALEYGEEVVRKTAMGAGLEAVDTATSYHQQATDLAANLWSMTDGSLVVVLDTFEELESNWPEMAKELYGLFAVFASHLPRFRLVVSGRAPAAVFVDRSRPDRQLHVLPLEDNAARSLLRYIVGREAARAERAAPPIDEQLAREIVELVGGIPLTLQVAARVLIRDGAAAIADATERARTLDRVRSEFVRGFLYQRILDHITAPDPADTGGLREIARASLVLRRITVEQVERVLLPAVERPPDLSSAEIFKLLASEVAFVAREGDALWLREDLRGPALAALKLDNSELVRLVHERAAAYYADTSSSTGANVELAYHRLALGDLTVPVDSAALRRIEPQIADLPQSSATLVQRSLRDPAAPEAWRDLANWERKVVPSVDGALRTGDLGQARQLLAQRSERTAGSELYRLESRLEEAAGNLRAATSAARQDLVAATAASDAARVAAAAVRLAGLYERLGEPGAADEVLRETADTHVLAGHPQLRLELILNQMNTRERAGRATDDSRWVLGLDARVLMQRINPRVLDSSSALIRLLAAALGREEPERVQLAVRRIGLGHEEDPHRVRALVSAVAAWDNGQPEPGRLAREFGLRVDDTDPDGIERAWSVIAGLGTDAGLLLDRVWRAAPPPESVREATRMIYLWWAVPTQQPLPTGAASIPPVGVVPGSVHADEPTPYFLAQIPLDWSRPETRELEDIMLTAYRTSTDSRALADLAGLDVGKISWASSGRRITRELLGTASQSGKLDDLVEAMLHDRAAVSVHDRLRTLVGEEWLDRHQL